MHLTYVNIRGRKGYFTMVQEGINESNGVELREQQIPREITKVIFIDLNRELGKIQGQKYILRH